MPEADKLHIDDDWKAQAQQEKEQLARELESRSTEPLPGPSFAEVINVLAMQAMVGLGGLAGPGGQQIPPNLETAKHFIDLLEVLEQKTKGNLTDDEKRILDASLYNLRMAYVEMVSAATGPPPVGP